MIAGRSAVTVLAAGGTIAMAGEPGGPVSPAHGADELLAAAGLDGLRARTLTTKPSAQLTLADALAIAHAAAGAGGPVVVTSGTDCLEELAMLCDLVHGGAAPVVLTGAMRPASDPRTDGPRNLADALAVATAPAAAGLGALVVAAGEVHAAAEVRKQDSTADAAFGSPRAGALGPVAGPWRRPPRQPQLAPAALGHRVAVVQTGLGDDGAAVAALAAAVDGLVAVVLGAGHTPPPALEALRAAAGRIPVIATVRPPRGAILHDSYAFTGAEGDLRASAIIPAAALSPAAARIKLLAVLATGADPRAAFAVDDR